MNKFIYILTVFLIYMSFTSILESHEGLQIHWKTKSLETTLDQGIIDHDPQQESFEEVQTNVEDILNDEFKNMPSAPVKALPEALNNLEHELLKKKATAPPEQVKARAPLEINEDKPIASPSTKVLNLEEPSGIKADELKVHSAFVHDLGNNKFEVTDDIQKAVPTLISMSDLAYLIGRDEKQKVQSLTQNFREQGWDIKTFKGFTGLNNSVEDTPGFVAYNKTTNQMTIVFRGSQSLDMGWQSPDWQVNFDAELIETPHGYIHKGFYNRTNANMDGAMQQVEAFFADMTDEQRKNVRFIVTGHSQGAAEATLASAILVDELKSTKYFGPQFDNNKTNTIITYLLEAPRVGDEQARDWIHSLVGKANIIRQNVIGLILADPVPSASPGKTMAKILAFIIGKDFAKKYAGESGTASVGYLAGDLSIDAITRDFSNKTIQLAERTIERTAASLATSLMNALKDPSTFKKYLQATSIEDFLLQFVNDNIGDVAWTLFAPLHSGSTEDQALEGPYFSPKTVAGYLPDSPTLSQLLTQGAIKQETGFSGFAHKVAMFLKL